MRGLFLIAVLVLGISGCGSREGRPVEGKVYIIEWGGPGMFNGYEHIAEVWEYEVVSGDCIKFTTRKLGGGHLEKTVCGDRQIELRDENWREQRRRN
jgi:hypothetical protein